MRTVVIKGVEYRLAYNLRTLFTYEEMAGKPYSGEKTADNYLLMYAMLLANNESFCMSFDELIDACDEDFGLFDEFSQVLTEYGKRASAFLSNKKKAEKL